MPRHALATCLAAATVAISSLIAWPAEAISRHNTTAPSGPALDPVGNLGPTLAAGASLYEGQYLASPSGQHILLTDGSSGEDLGLLLTGPGCTPRDLYSKPTTVPITYTLTMQTDGNLVLKTPTAVVWASGTAGNTGAKATLQNDGNLVIISATGTPLKGMNGLTTVGECDSMTGLTTPASNGYQDRNVAYLLPGHTLYNQKHAHNLKMGTDGRLVLKNAAGTELWATPTAGNPDAKAVVQSDGNVVILSKDGTRLWQSGTFVGVPVHATLTLTNDGHLIVDRNTQDNTLRKTLY